MKLYTYFRSSAAYRVRIALNFKNISVEMVPVSLLNGEHRDEAYQSINPQGLVPLLELDDGTQLHQSLSILQYLEDVHPTPALLPIDPIKRAQVLALCQELACDVHPLNNLRVLKYLESTLAVDAAAKQHWYEHWIAVGFKALEARLATTGAANHEYCFGEMPTLADCVLIPQVYNALRFKCDLEPYPIIRAVYDHCNTLDAFARAAPETQIDAI